MSKFTVPDLKSPPVEGASHPARKAVGYPTVVMPLLHHWAYLTRLVIIVVYEAHSWVRTVDDFSPPTSTVVLGRTVKLIQSKGNFSSDTT